MNQIISCPKCNARSWSSDYWTCSNCSYSESREWVLLDENKDFKENRNKGDNPALNLSFWMDEQKKLCKEIITDCLPNRNLQITFRKYLGGWGWAIYRENDASKAKQAEKRFSKDKINVLLKWDWIVNLVIHDSRPSEINISPYTLKTKYSPLTSFGPRGSGFLPTTTHELAHISHEVVHNPKFKPWINNWHDEIWKIKAIDFHDKMLIKHGQKIEERFKELEKIEEKK